MLFLARVQTDSPRLRRKCICLRGVGPKVGRANTLGIDYYYQLSNWKPLMSTRLQDVLS